LGPAEILVILVVALIVLGPKKLPEAGRQVGRAIAEVRKWSQGFQDEVRNVLDPDASAPSYPPMQSNPIYPDAEPAPAREAGPTMGSRPPMRTVTTAGRCRCSSSGSSPYWW